jgi:hypothetical protein
MRLVITYGLAESESGEGGRQADRSSTRPNWRRDPVTSTAPVCGLRVLNGCRSGIQIYRVKAVSWAPRRLISARNHDSCWPFSLELAVIVWPRLTKQNSPKPKSSPPNPTRFEGFLMAWALGFLGWSLAWLGSSWAGTWLDFGELCSMFCRVLAVWNHIH